MKLGIKNTYLNFPQKNLECTLFSQDYLWGTVWLGPCTPSRWLAFQKELNYFPYFPIKNSHSDTGFQYAGKGVSIAHWGLKHWIICVESNPCKALRWFSLSLGYQKLWSLHILIDTTKWGQMSMICYNKPKTQPWLFSPITIYYDYQTKAV